MAFLEWRRFNFFDLKKDIDSGTISQHIGDVRITASSSGHGFLILGDSDGSVHLVNRNFQITSFRAYDRNISVVEQAKQSSFLFTIGEDEVGVNPIIKVWNIDKLDKNGHPVCVRISRAVLPNRAVATTCLCVNDTLTLMAVGFVDGSIVLYRGDVTRERTSKQKPLKNGCHSCVTGLAFHQTAKHTYLFVSTLSGVYLYNITHKDKEEKDEVDSIGCALRCSVMASSVQDTHFMIAKDDAVYCYSTEGRGSCYAVEGQKILLQWFRSYLIIVAKDVKNTANPSDSERHILTVLDIQNKFIVFSAPMKEVCTVLIEWGSFYVLTADNRLSVLIEKDLQSKLALLFKKNLYDVSIRIAKSHQYDVEGLVDIFRQYGDHLYSKGDHNAAIEQYIKTIGKLEPSYVIRKFLQSHQIDNLTHYLQALHKQGVATADHTTLLLNCYTKLTKIDKLKEFIMTKDREVDFDVEVAINVCRQASSEDALLLAEKHGLHSWYLKIQIEDHHKYTAALDYIAKLEFSEAEKNMKKYGNILLQHAPKETTDFLKRLCTDYRPSNKPLVDQNMLDGRGTVQIDRASPEDFIHMFLNNSERLVDFLEHLVQATPKLSKLVYNTLIEHYLHLWNNCSDMSIRLQWEHKVVHLLESSDSNYDKHQTLILCQAANFRPGILYLYEENKLYQQILNHHLNQQDYQSVLTCCRRFGNQDPNLWVQALWAGAKDYDMPSSLLVEILNVIEKKCLLSPLLVVDALCNWNTVKVGDVRSYLNSVLHSEEKTTGQEEALIKKYQQETERIRKHIQDIQTSAIVFQGSRCSACNHQLELPSVHFLCQHSYHQHCFQSFAENENECPACLPNNKQILDIIKSQEQGRDLHETFHSQLERAEDGFSLVADYFGRGVFHKYTVSDTLLKSAAFTVSSIMSSSTTSMASEKEKPKHLDQLTRNKIGGSSEQLKQNEKHFQPLPRKNQSYTSFLDASPPLSPWEKVQSAAQLTTPDTVSRAITQPSSVGKNPFEEEYPQDRNPFEQDGDNDADKNNIDDDDYDKNLNPFAT